MKKNDNFTKTSGFSLLEMLLTTFIVFGLFIVVLNIIQAYSERVLAKSAAEYYTKIAKSVDGILENPEYYQALYRDADAQPNDVLELTTEQIKTGFITDQFPSISIPKSSILSSEFSDMTPFRTNTLIMLRKINTGSGDALELIISSDEPIEGSRVRRAASFLEGHGGVLSNNSDVTAAFASWSLPLGYLNNTNLSSAVLSNPPSVTNSYLVYYDYRPFIDVTGDYLYRKQVVGQPELNRMYSVLDMGENNILGADDIDPSGTLVLESGLIVNGSMQANENVEFLSSNMTASRQLVTNNAQIDGAGNGERGNFNIQGTLNTVNVSATNRTSATNVSFEDGLITSGTLLSNEMDLSNNINTQKINANTISIDGATKYDVDVSGQLSTGDLVVNGLNLDGTTNIGTVNMVIGQETNPGNATFQGGVTAPVIGIKNLDTANFGACDKGC